MEKDIVTNPGFTCQCSKWKATCMEKEEPEIKSENQLKRYTAGIPQKIKLDVYKHK
jgi:hypothetical protein